MNYKTYDLNAYQLHCIKETKFKTTKVSINFKRKVKKEEITMRSLLSKIVLEASNNYPTSRLMSIETENLYNLQLDSCSFLSGNYSVIGFEAMFLNDKCIDDNLFDQAISFVMDIIINPLIENDAFNKKSFELAKKLLEEEIKSLKDNPKRYGLMRLCEEIDKTSIASFNAIGYLEDLESITPKSLYDYYKTVIKSDLIDIFVISPNDNNVVKEKITSTLKLNTLKKKSESHFVKYDSYRKRNKIVHEKSKFKQSKLYIGCKFDKLSDFELKYVSAIYSYILGGGPASKLFKVVREENSLCYSISSSFKAIYYGLLISAGINSKDFKKCLRLIKKQIKDMSNGKFEDDKIEEAKITYLNSFKEIKDSPSSILNTYISHEYLGADVIDEREKGILKVTREMIISFAKKIHIDTVYVLEGSGEDE